MICVRKSDGTLRLCVDRRKLNVVLKTDSGGLGDMHRIFAGLRGKSFFTQVDLASGFHQITIAEKDRPKTAFRDADGQLHEFNRAGFGLTVLPAAFTRVVKKALAPPLPGVDSWLDDIIIASRDWKEHLATLKEVFTRLLKAKLSVNFSKCHFAAPCQEFLGMVNVHWHPPGTVDTGSDEQDAQTQDSRRATSLPRINRLPQAIRP